MKNLAERLNEIESFKVVDFITQVSLLESQGKSIINLVVGEPDFPTPQPIVDSAIEALKKNKIKYTPSLGIQELRNEISKWYKTRYSLEVDPKNIAITSGASAGLLLTMGVMLSPGDEVMMADPGYPCNRHIVRAMEGKSLPVNCSYKTSYQLDLELVKANWTDKTKAVLIASPSNPTGTIINFEELKKIYDFVKSKDGYLILDEIYHGVTFGEKDVSALKLSKDIITINSFSKYFCMTGWRLGWVILPDHFIEPFEKLAQNLFISSCDISQTAAISAFSNESIKIAEENRKKYKIQRDFLLPKLRNLGFKIPVAPDGAFYIYADSSNFSNNSLSFCYDVLEKSGVAIAPGIDFGFNDTKNHVRFSFPKTVSVLNEGVNRIENYLKKYKN